MRNYAKKYILRIGIEKSFYVAEQKSLEIGLYKGNIPFIECSEP